MCPSPRDLVLLPVSNYQTRSRQALGVEALIAECRRPTTAESARLAAVTRAVPVCRLPNPVDAVPKGCSARPSNENLEGITPTIVKSLPLSVSVLPMTV